MPNPAYTINPVYARRARKDIAEHKSQRTAVATVLFKKRSGIGVTNVREQEALKRASQDLLIRRKITYQTRTASNARNQCATWRLAHLIGDSKTCEAIFCA